MSMLGAPIRWTCFGLLALAIPGGCDGGDEPSPAEARCGSGPSADERAQNQVIFDGLRGSCEGCHLIGARGYFASIEAFEALVAYNPAMVKPGAPEDSQLVRLLEGDGSGPFVQMPPGGATYSALVEEGRATLSMAEIRDWVEQLGDHAVDPNPSAVAPRVTRLAAADVQRALYQQLGLSDADFFIPASNYGIPHKSTGQNDEKYPLSSLDAIPPPFEDLPAERFASLGGGSALEQRRTDGSVLPGFAGSLAQIAQRWCALAIDKPGNAALVPEGTSVTAGGDDPGAVKATIRGWFLHFHSVAATDAEVDHVFDTLFVPLEVDSDTRTAYVGVCSYFVRHPDWVFY